MTTNDNNILSYFIKDIKDPIEQAKYKQINNINQIKIFYETKLLYTNDLLNSFIHKYMYNIFKSNYFRNFLYTYNFNFIKKDKHKYLHYNNNFNLGNGGSRDHIDYYYIHGAYLNKIYVKYTINGTLVFSTRFCYDKGYKYIFRFTKFTKIHTFTNFHKFHKFHKFHNFTKFYNSLILIKNKYELHYYNSFFNFYFVY